MRLPQPRSVSAAVTTDSKRNDGSILSGPNRGLRWTVRSGVHGYWIGWYQSEATRFIAAVVRPGMIAANSISCYWRWLAGN
jgi:hypothetical protein